MADDYKNNYVAQYRKGWQMHQQGKPFAKAFYPGTKAGWLARDDYMASTLPEQVAALAEAVADLTVALADVGEGVTA